MSGFGYHLNRSLKAARRRQREQLQCASEILSVTYREALFALRQSIGEARTLRDMARGDAAAPFFAKKFAEEVLTIPAQRIRIQKLRGAVRLLEADLRQAR